MTVTVVSVDLHGPVACQMGYTREHEVYVTPTSANEDVFFVSADEGLLYVSRKELTEDGALLELRAESRGTPVVEARLGSATGPVITTQEIDEYVLNIPARESLDVCSATRVGRTTITIWPYIPYLSFGFRMNGGTATFEGGVSEFGVEATEFTRYLNHTDGSVYGEYRYNIEIPEGEDSLCFSVHVFQNVTQEDIDEYLNGQ